MILLLTGATLSIVGLLLWRSRGLPGAGLTLAGVVILAAHFRPTGEADRARPSRSDFATPPPAAPLPEPTVASAEPADLLTTLHDLLDEDARTDGATFGPTPGVSGSDVVGFWRAFTEQLLESGVRTEYVAALQSSSSPFAGISTSAGFTFPKVRFRDGLASG